MTIKILSAEFNQKQWIKYVEYSKEIVKTYSSETRDMLNECKIPADLKIVLIYKFKKNAEKWLYKDIPALENKKPIDLFPCQNGINAVKEVLLRIPE